MKNVFGMILVLFQFGAFSFWWFFSPLGIQRVNNARKLTKQLDAACNEALAEQKNLKALLHSWENDPYLLEKYAREHLGMSKADEYVVVLDR